VMIGPAGQSAAGAGRYGYLRASRADREQVVDVLKAAYVQGRLEKDELDLRIGQAFTSRTYAQLNTLTVDLPAGLSAGPPAGPARERDSQLAVESRDRKVAAAWACATITLPSMAVAVALMESGAAIGLVLLAVVLFASMVAMPAGGLIMLHSEPENRPSSELSG
jgi:Domain of unknown function (DUF1707)